MTDNSQPAPAGDVAMWKARLAEATLEIEEIDQAIRDTVFFDPKLEDRRRQANWHAFGITLRLSEALSAAGTPRVTDWRQNRQAEN
jgi:hypothetical protein